MNSLDVYLGHPGDFIKQFPVVHRRNGKGQEALEREEEEAMQLLAELESGSCEVCGQGDREDSLLICDSCQLMFHLECLELPLPGVPEEDWYCENCAHLTSFGLSLNARVANNRGERPPRTVGRSRASSSRRVLLNQTPEEEGGGGGISGGERSQSRDATWEHEMDIARSQQRRTYGLHRFASNQPAAMTATFQRSLREIARARTRLRSRRHAIPDIGDEEYWNNDGLLSQDSGQDLEEFPDFRGDDDERAQSDPAFRRKRKRAEASRVALRNERQQSAEPQGPQQPAEGSKMVRPRADLSTLSKERLEKHVLKFGNNEVPETYLLELARKESSELAASSSSSRNPFQLAPDSESLQLARDKKLRMLQQGSHFRETSSSPLPTERRSSSLLVFQGEPQANGGDLTTKKPAPPPPREIPRTKQEATVPSTPPPVSSPSPLPPALPVPRVSREDKEKIVGVVKQQLAGLYHRGNLDKEEYKALAKSVTDEVLSQAKIPWETLAERVKEIIGEKL